MCEKFSKFNKFNDSLDLFLGEFILPKKDEFKNFWKICIFIFTLSHGQSQVEREFNINKNTLQENLVDAEKYFNPELLKIGNKLRKTIKENSEKKKKIEHDIARLELDLKEIS